MVNNVKACEVVGEKVIFRQHLAWMRVMEDSVLYEAPCNFENKIIIINCGNRDGSFRSSLNLKYELSPF